LSNELIERLSRAQDQYFGEPVTQLEHALQCANLARQAKADDDLVLAALLHDIGHLIADGDEYGATDHDQAGAAYLEELGLGGRVAALVRYHVAAKRYLTAVNPDYFDGLSEASKYSLELQGGPMTEDEAKKFAEGPLFKDALRLRTWDEQAKEAGLPVPDLESYREMLERRLR
jgi:2-amino-1-hydroxyethylphosphonate dioxygenase (glycine-forming)